MSLSKALCGRLLRQISKSLIGGNNGRNISFRIHDDDLTCRYECFFTREDIDGWDIRQGMNDLLGYDAVPEPAVIIAALHACRRVNDYALSVRFLEAVKDKCGSKVNVIYPYIVQEIAPTLCELGCDLPEGLGYHKPELFLPNIE